MPAMTATNSQKDGLAKSISDHPRFAQQALWPVEEKRDQGGEGEDGLETRFEPAEQSFPGRQLHREPKHKTPNESAISAADAAEHDGGEDKEQHLRPDIRIDRALDNRKHHSADAGEPAGDKPDIGSDPHDIDA